MRAEKPSFQSGCILPPLRAQRFKNPIRNQQQPQTLAVSKSRHAWALLYSVHSEEWICGLTYATLAFQEESILFFVIREEIVLDFENLEDWANVTSTYK